MYIRCLCRFVCLKLWLGVGRFCLKEGLEFRGFEVFVKVSVFLGEVA